MVKNLPAMRETWVQSLGWEDTLEGMATHSSVVGFSSLENPHGQRRLAGYSPQGHKESDTTQRLGTDVQEASVEEVSPVCYGQRCHNHP